MASPSLFTASRTQTLTYLLGVCPFSIAFLVFINSSVSFVVTELIGIHTGEGNAVGTLGFADELLALAACPLWGVLSDRIGVRHVCTAGYAIVALALVLFVQAKNVYPQLLLGRLLFSLGGSAVSTMVTAVLPAVTGRPTSYQISQPLGDSQTNSSNNQSGQSENDTIGKTPSSRLAGFVGTCAGCGALVALVVFLPLPAKFQDSGFSPAQSIQYSYYLVAVVALVISMGCLFGLKDLPGEERRGWSSLWSTAQNDTPQSICGGSSCSVAGKSRLPYLDQFSAAIVLGFRNRDIFIGYLGGFVARASSVGISLFIPLFVNHYYRASGLCHGGPDGAPEDGPGDIKRSCPQAYVLASILTGASQLIALITAPAFGYLSEKSQRYHLPLLVACFAGVIGYTTFGLMPSPEFKGSHGSPAIFLVVALIGISQIGAIVCSLAVLSNGILNIQNYSDLPKQTHSPRGTGPSEENTNHATNARGEEPNEQQPLLATSSQDQTRQSSHLKGSIAGVYSLYGGAGILILTKLGGLLFDVSSPGTPFYIMAGFNGALLLAGVIGGLVGSSKRFLASDLA